MLRQHKLCGTLVHLTFQHAKSASDCTWLCLEYAAAGAIKCGQHMATSLARDTRTGHCLPVRIELKKLQDCCMYRLEMQASCCAKVLHQ